MITRATLTSASIAAGFALAALAGTAGAEILSVPTDFPTIQDAIDRSNAGDTIEVAPGTYTENLRIADRSITLRAAGGASATTLRPAAAGLPVIWVDGGDGVTIEGFTVTGGDSVNGGGLFATGETTVRSCRFAGNAATRGGAAFFGARATVSDTTFEDNSAMFGGAVFGKAESVRFEHATFTANEARHGGGAYVSESGSTPATAVFYAVRFTGNIAERGAAIATSAERTDLSQSELMRNANGDNGSFWAASGAATISFTRFQANLSGAPGAAVATGAAAAASVESSEFIANDGGHFPADAAVLAPGSNLVSMDTIADQAMPYGQLDILDIMGFAGKFNARDITADVDWDGHVNVFDLITFFGEYAASL